MEISKVKEEIWKKYNDDPRNWSFWISRDKNGEFYDLFIIHKDECYFIKMDTIYKPNPLGLGKKMKVDTDFSSKLPESGFRKMDRSELEELFNKPKKLFKREPTSFDDLKENEVGFMGPQYMSQEPPQISEGQKKLDEKLSEELRKLMRRESYMYQ